MNVNVDALISLWWLWLTLILTIVSLVQIGILAKKNDSQFGSVPGFIAAIGWGYLVWTETSNIILAVVYGFYCIYIFIQLEVFFRYDHKPLRFIYYLLMDGGFFAIPVVLLVLTGWEWYGYLLALVAAVLYLGLMNAIFTGINRKMMLQETYFLATDKNERKKIYHQITLLRLPEFQRKMAYAKQHVRQGQYNKASPDVFMVIGEFDKAGLVGLNNPQKQVLGEACMLRARINLHLKRFTEAEKDAQRAKQYITLDPDTLGLLAEAGAGGEKLGNANGWCLDYLAARQETPPAARTQKVSDYLERQCELREDSAASAIDTAQALAREVIKADGKLGWPYRVLGQAAALRKQWQEARQLLEPAEQQQPDNKAIPYFLGLAYYNLKEYRLAYPRLRRTLQDNPEQPQAAFALAMILLDAFQAGKPLTGSPASDLNEAVEWLERAAAGDKNNPEILYQLAKAYVQQGQPKKAFPRLDAVLAGHAGHIPSRRLYAGLCYQDARLDQAAHHYGKIPRPDLSQEETLQYGHCLVELRRDEEALQLLGGLVPSTPRGVFLTGRALLHQGRYPEAVALLESLAQAHKNADAVYYLGCALAWQAKTDTPAALRKAAEKFKFLLEPENAFSARAHLQLGLISLAQRDFPLAESHFRIAQKSKGLELEAGMGLARANLAMDKAGEAQNILEALETRHGADTRLQILLGLCQECQGQYADAEQAYRRAKATASLGVVLYLQGKVEEAARVIQQARQQGDTSDRLLYYAGLALADRMQYPEAIREWDMLAKRHPEDTRLRLNIARAWYLHAAECFAQGDLPATVAAWENFLEIYAQDEETRRNTGLLHLRLALGAQEHAEAVPHIQKARKLGTSAALCDQVEALCLFTAGKQGEGIKTLEKLHARNQANPASQFNLGLALLRGGQTGPAIPFLEQAWGSNEEGVKQAAGWALAAACAETGNWSQVARIVQSSQPV